MTKNCARVLFALALVISSFLVTAQPAQSIAAGDCVRDTTWTGPNGERLDCYHCKEATYCYPAS
jgi:hypothetical protein